MTNFSFVKKNFYRIPRPINCNFLDDSVKLDYLNRHTDVKLYML